ncbi:1,4-dihydropyridine esterase [Streptomyces paludis]|uniref:1,4-dihydropyridine esterase n=2 Tax=Streptomyces paludis TaxID=2282738 RepID=A0A345HQP6_9ACTN|nr:1,4-dihydropyridine esterase [Streptomyces paludis]
MVAALLTAGLVSGATAHTATASVTEEADGAGVFVAQGPQAEAGGTVTLITGDQVRMDGKGRVVRVQPGQGREGTRMNIRTVGDEVYVLPADAIQLVAQGKLDRRLFNVTSLRKTGYGDDRRASLPLIVSYGKNAARKAEARTAIAEADVSVRRTLPAIDGEALTAPKDEAAEVWDALTEPTDVPNEARETAPGIERVWLDGTYKALLDKSGAQIGTGSAYQAGYTGVGVKVAVLDTGVDQTHPDLAGVSIARKDFSGSGNTVDHHGHGTHVASTIAGSGAKSGWKYFGVAPGAKIIDAKVLNDNGEGSESGIIAGMQWAVDQGAKIANMSLGREDSPDTDPLEAAVKKLSAENDILFVIAAGNEGPRAKTVGSPGSSTSALTVGAVDSNDRIADFSSVGPTSNGSLKPDITAPGVGIVAAKAAKGVIGDPAADGYVALSGTSMATPHVAGAAALLAQQHPDWSGQRIKKALVSSARPGAGQSVFQQGAGRADLTKAITQTVLSEQVGLNFGIAPWPHTYDLPVTKQITYNNTGTAPVTLDVSMETTGPGGKAVADGFFVLSATKVTVPAGGRTSIDLRANTNIGGTDGVFTGTVVARSTDGSQNVRTTFAVEREGESYDVTLKFIDNNGKPTASSAWVLSHDGRYDENVAIDSSDGTATIRLPKGPYTLSSAVVTGSDVAWLVQPKLNVVDNSTVTFDARTAKPVSITAPDSSAKLFQAFASFGVDAGDQVQASLWTLDSFKGLRVGHVGPQVPTALMNAQLGGLWQKGSTSYNLLYNRTGSFYTGFTHTADMSELALVNARFGSSAKNRTGSLMPGWVDSTKPTPYSIGLMTDSFSLPTTAKTYFTTPKYLTWELAAYQDDDDGFGVDLESGDPRTYEAGKTYSETFNVGVFSPKEGSWGSERFGNEMRFCMGEFTDGVGHRGTSGVSKQRTTVTVDGKSIVDSDLGACGILEGLPAKSATYKISTEATRPARIATVTSRLVAAWTFASKQVTGSAPEQLPINIVRFTPSLDLTSTAKAGETVTFPLHVRGPAQHNLGSLTVQVSYDGGKVWANTPVTYGTGTDGRHHITLTHPTTATSVSLKAKVTDTSGNAYEVTVEKAYLLN